VSAIHVGSWVCDADRRAGQVVSRDVVWSARGELPAWSVVKWVDGSFTKVQEASLTFLRPGELETVTVELNMAQAVELCDAVASASSEGQADEMLMIPILAALGIEWNPTIAMTPWG
jgi:hypothetical protein